VPHRHDTLATLVARLTAATYFEDAATAVLQTLFNCAETTLTTSPYASNAQLLRGVIHLRPEGTYQRLFGIDRKNGERIDGAAYVTSANIWAWIEASHCSLSIDVQASMLRAWGATGPLLLPNQRLDAGLPGDRTRKKLLGRDATHVHAIPLLAPGGSVHGMITLEMSCKVAIGREFIWEACHEVLQMLAGVSGAFLAARTLPKRPDEFSGVDKFLPVVGATTAPLVELLAAFAPREDTILITGPTGVGKSRLARFAHEHSSRKGQTFEMLDLLGIPDELQMGEIFGWKRGAFSSAHKDHLGAITRAEKGTLFIDEIDKLSMKAQAGLLHFIESRAYRMLGDDAAGERRADVRLLVGTNANLRKAVRAGEFREDLYYRINVLPVRVPALADRLDELPRWADYMLKQRHLENTPHGSVSFEPAAKNLLLSVPWPGNLRQLDNIIRRAYALRLGGTVPTGDIVVERRHVERALTFDADTEPSALVDLLWRAALAFVQEAQRPETSLPLDMAEAFRGMVLGAAIQQMGSRDEAFAILGQQALIKNRNHHRVLKRELAKVKELFAALGCEDNSEFEALLAMAEEPGD